MKCPKCNEQIMSFVDFYLWSHPFSTKCKKCGVKIQPDSKIKKTFLLEVVLAFVLFGIVDLTLGIISLKGLIAYILVTAIALFPFEKYSWENGSYKEKE